MPAHLTSPFKALAATSGSRDKESLFIPLTSAPFLLFPPSWRFYQSRDGGLLFYIVIRPVPPGFHLQLSAGHGKRAKRSPTEGGETRNKENERGGKKRALNERGSEREREKQLCLKCRPNVVEMESVTQFIACWWLRAVWAVSSLWFMDSKWTPAGEKASRGSEPQQGPFWAGARPRVFFRSCQTALHGN